MAIEKLRARRIPFLVINLCSSFSSLFICLFIIKELAQMSGKENLFQALGLAVYLGGLAIGSIAFKGEKGRYSGVSLCEVGNSFFGIHPTGPTQGYFGSRGSGGLSNSVYC